MTAPDEVRDTGVECQEDANEEHSGENDVRDGEAGKSKERKSHHETNGTGKFIAEHANFLERRLDMDEAENGEETEREPRGIPQFQVPFFSEEEEEPREEECNRKDNARSPKEERECAPDHLPNHSRSPLEDEEENDGSGNLDVSAHVPLRLIFEFELIKRARGSPGDRTTLSLTVCNALSYFGHRQRLYVKNDYEDKAAVILLEDDSR